MNRWVKRWKLPENDFTKDEKVTLRRILSHSAGLTVPGFPVYAVNKTFPTLGQVLDGVKPANTAAIRVDVIPGSICRYSGGGYTVLQQMMIDTTGQPFPELMRQAVLTPLGMTASTYTRPQSLKTHFSKTCLFARRQLTVFQCFVSISTEH